MVYTPSTDFVSIWRASGGAVLKGEMPGLDFAVAALGRAGLINVAVSGTAPTSNQATTAWLDPAVPSWSAESALFLWNPATSAYAPASMALLLDMLQASAGQNGVSWYAVTGGAPSNTVGINGDFAIRTDQPGGIYGPKTLGAWPSTPLPGTTTGFVSTDLDVAFGADLGDILYRDALVWKARTIGAAGTILTPLAGVPVWATLSALLDAAFGSVEGDTLYRDAAAWQVLPPGTAGQFMRTGGAGNAPTWADVIPIGTNMLFQQTSAPLGWTKLTALNDVGLRVVSGAAGSFAGSPFTTVFSQTATGAHQLTVAEMPSHNHPTTLDGDNPVKLTPSGSGITAAGVSAQAAGDGGFSMSNVGGDGTHTHTIALQLSYVDVIIAAKN